MRIGADLLVCFAHERGELVVRQALVLDPHLDRDPEAAAFTRADRDGASDLRVRRIAFALLRHEVERAAEAGGIAGGKQMLRRRGARPAGTAHLLGHREVGLDEAVAGLGTAATAADGGRGYGIVRFGFYQRVHPEMGGSRRDARWRSVASSCN